MLVSDFNFNFEDVPGLDSVLILVLVDVGLGPSQRALGLDQGGS